MFLRIAVFILIIICCKSNIVSSGDMNNHPFYNKSINRSANSDDLNVSFMGDYLSVKARDVSIKAILEKIVKVTDIRVWIFSDAQEKITIELNDVSLQEGLKKILKNKSYGFVYKQDEDDIGLLRTIEVKQLFKSNFGRERRKSPTFPEKGKQARQRKAKNRNINPFQSNVAGKKKSKTSKNKFSKQEMKKFIENIDPNQLSSALSEALNTTLKDNKQIDFKQLLESSMETTTDSQDATTGGGASD